MPSSLNALLAAWAVSLIIVVGGILFFEVTYDPNADQAAAVEQDAGTSSQPAPSDETASNETGDGGTAQADTGGDSFGGNNAETALTNTQGGEEGGADDGSLTQDPATGMTQTRRPQPAQQEPARVAQIVGGVRVEADPGLIEQSNQGPLPRVSNEGARAFEVYSAPPPDTQDRAKIALIISELGMRSRSTRRAIADLPSRVTFAFSPYASNLMEWGEQARRTGHEVLLMVPMEPVNYPQNDPGPLSLLTSRSPRENINLLKSSLGRMTGYVGIVNHMGSRFTAASESLRPVLEEVQRRGLMLVDSRSTPYSRAASMARAIGLPTAFNNAYIDEDVNPAVIAQQLEELEKRARVYNYAVGMGRPYPVTIDAVKVWAAGLPERGFELVPITAVADRQPLPR